MYKDNPPAVERALHILETLANSPKSLTVKEISARLKIPHASAYRIVKCLQDFGYVRQSQSEIDKYRIGYKLNYLVANVSPENDLINIAFPYARELSEETGQACQIGILHNHCATIIEQSIPKNSITVIANLWEEIPINMSASGKVLTALLPPSEIKVEVTKSWEFVYKATAYTTTDLDDFIKEIEVIKAQKYATDNEEYATGIGCIAVPIFDYSGKAVAALGLTGHVTDLMNKDRFAILLMQLKEAAQKVSEKLKPN